MEGGGLLEEIGDIGIAEVGGCVLLDEAEGLELGHLADE